MLVSEGVNLITLHPRTQKQKNSLGKKRTEIRKIASASSMTSRTTIGIALSLRMSSLA